MTNTKGGTMTAEEQRWKDKAEQADWNWSNCSRACAHVQDERDKARAEVARLTAELETLRKVTETGSYTAEVELHLAEEAKSMALIIGLKDELAEARGSYDRGA